MFSPFASSDGISLGGMNLYLLYDVHQALCTKELLQFSSNCSLLTLDFSLPLFLLQPTQTASEPRSWL